MSLAERVLTTLAEITDVDELRTNLDVRLYDTHLLDSMKTVELMLAFADRFGVEISPAEFNRDQWATPGMIIQDIEARMAR